jgi:hypothetical protein
MPRRKSLSDARRLFRARKYPDVIRVLEPEVFRFRENHEYFSLLGYACLQTGDLGGASSYITRAHQLKPGDIDALLGLAAIQLRKADPEGALKRWLEVLDEDPGNQVARRGLAMLRKGLSRDGLQDLIDSGRVRQLYPPHLGKGRLAWLIAVGVFAAAVLASGLVVVLVSRPRGPGRPDVAGVELPADLPRFTEESAGVRYTMSEKQVRQAFQKVKKEMLAFHDNLAVREANMILLSNASTPVKERARLLKSHAVRPSFTTIRDPFPYKDVVKEPDLYDGCAVVWRGKLANLSLGEKSISFDLLVGYEAETELAGIVPVTLDFPVQLENGIALEVLGTVSAAASGLALRGISVHRLSSPQESR